MERGGGSSISAWQPNADASFATSFVGRANEIAAIRRAFDEGDRLVALLGVAGAGKTRLACHYAASSCEAGLVCELADARTVDDLCRSLARDLDVPLTAGQTIDDAVRTLGYALATRGRTLFVFDNFEQLVEHAPATLERWLAIAPLARFLVTSRERLRIRGEHCVDVGPLALPAADATDVRAVLESEAVRLFVARTKLVRNGYEPPATELATLAAIVRRLDGLPLAIELAAARMRTLAAAQLAELLGRSLDVLASDLRSAAPRHATLRGAIEWSWNLLGDRERNALAATSVFRGGFDFDAARAILEPEASSTSVLELVQGLHDKSLLVIYEAWDGSRRYGMYQAVAAFASTALDASDAAGAVRARHAGYFLRFAEHWAALADGPEGVTARRRLKSEADNVLAVYEDAMRGAAPTSADVAVQLRALLALEPVFLAEGPLREYMTRLDAALAAAARAGGVASDLLARARVSRGWAAYHAGEFAAAVRFLDSALPRVTGRSDPRLETLACTRLGLVHAHCKRRKKSDAAFARARRLLRTVRDPALEGAFLWLRGTALHHLEAHDRSRKHLDAALALFRRLNAPRDIGFVLSELAADDVHRGALSEAQRHAEAALASFRETGDRGAEGRALLCLATIDQELRRYGEASSRMAEALALYRRIGHRRAEAACLLQLGALAIERRFPQEARQYARAAMDVAEEIDAQRLLGGALAVHAAADALQGLASIAAATFRRAEVVLRASGRRTDRDMLVLLRAHLALSADPAQSARRATAYRAEWDAACKLAKRLGRTEGRAGGQRRRAPADEVRFALRAFENLRVMRAGARGQQHALVVDASGAWFSRSRRRVDLRRRKSLRLLLAKLTSERLRAPDCPVPADALIGAGWPGEVIQTDAAAARLRVAISMLRKLGLGGVLVTRPAGYLLDPSAPIRLAEPAA